MKTQFRAALFDLDGTLADSLADLANATNWALAKLDCPTHPLEEYRYLVGDGARTLCQRALPRDKQGRIDDALRLMRQHYDAHCFDETRLYHGIIELVSEMKHRGCRLAVLSNKPDDFTKRMIDRYFKPNPFLVTRGHLAHVPLKPDPTAALEIARELGVTAAECLYLGDTNTDMQTACSAGMFPVGVLWGFRDRDELVESGAKVVVSQPVEVLALL